MKRTFRILAMMAAITLVYSNAHAADPTKPAETKITKTKIGASATAPATFKVSTITVKDDVGDKVKTALMNELATSIDKKDGAPLATTAAFSGTGVNRALVLSGVYKNEKFEMTSTVKADAKLTSTDAADSYLAADAAKQLRVKYKTKDRKTTAAKKVSLRKIDEPPAITTHQ